MIFRETPIAGAFLIDLEKRVDERGSFARVWCAREFEQLGIDSRMAQCSLSSNTRRGTLRGLHYSVPPRAEAKVIRCVRGAIYDVLVDLRRESPSYRRHTAQMLTAENGLALYAPEGVAHGFQTLRDDTDVLYQMTEFFDPACARGVRWNDPAFGISWPDGEPIISERDRSYPDYYSGPLPEGVHG